jgi:CBS domain-containing protein
MTEKIVRRGIQLPENYRPDILELKTVSDVFRRLDNNEVLTCNAHDSLYIIIEMMANNAAGYILVSNENRPLGIINKQKLLEAENRKMPVGSLLEEEVFTIYPDNSLAIALEIMLRTNQTVLPVVHRTTKRTVGIITEWDIFRVFERRFMEDKHITQHISIKKKALKYIRKATMKR